MFLLIRLNGLCYSRLSLHFTFHYVSINTETYRKWNQEIYRFTFHYVSINTQVPEIYHDPVETLHSTMFLLIQPWHHRKPRHHRNFTFHYVSINTDVSGWIICRSPSFTFHYVSINTGNRRNPYVAKKTNFTFHYVSINTQCSTAE